MASKEPDQPQDRFFLGLTKAEWYATAVFYARLIVFVGTIAIVLVVLEHSEYPVIVALKDIIGYAIALGTSIYLKLYKPLWYENMKWFIAPGNVFLRSWLGVFFYVYLVALPLRLAKVAPLQIVSWFAQCIIGPCLALFISGAPIAFSLFLIKRIGKMRKAAAAAAGNASDEASKESGDESARGTEVGGSNPLHADADTAAASSSPQDGATLRVPAQRERESVYTKIDFSEAISAMAYENLDGTSGKYDILSQYGFKTTGSPSVANQAILINGKFTLDKASNMMKEDVKQRNLVEVSRESTVIADSAWFLPGVFSNSLLAQPDSTDHHRGPGGPGGGGGGGDSSGRQSEMRNVRSGTRRGDRQRSNAPAYQPDSDWGAGWTGHGSATSGTSRVSEAKRVGFSGGGGAATGGTGGVKPTFAQAGVDAAWGGGDVATAGPRRKRGDRNVSFHTKSSDAPDQGKDEGKGGDDDGAGGQGLSITIVDHHDDGIELSAVELDSSGAESEEPVGDPEQGGANAGDIGEQQQEAQPLPSPPEALPFVPTMDQIFKFWVFVLLVTIVITYLSPSKTQSSVVAFQLSATILIYMASTTYRKYLIGWMNPYAQQFLQNVMIFMLLTIPTVILSSVAPSSEWELNLAQYQTGLPLLRIAEWGAGDFLALFVNPGVVTFAFASVDAFIVFADIMPLLFVLIPLGCLGIMLVSALVAWACQSTIIIALPLLLKSMTTGVAVSIGTSLGVPPGLIAASTLTNALVAYQVAPQLLTKYRIKNPVSRGIAASMSGSLLAVMALDEGGEKVASGVGMAGYALATIFYALLLSITPLKDLLVQLTGAT